jgi:hypothetical protein
MDTFSWKRLFLHLPKRCEACQAEGLVSLESTAIGSVVALRWHCRGCGRQWATTTAEMQADRRSGAQDPRWSTRETDRRQRAGAHT